MYMKFEQYYGCYIPEDEEVLATVKSGGFFNSEKYRYIATNKRLIMIRLKLFNRSQIRSLRWDEFKDIQIDEGLITSRIDFDMRDVCDDDGNPMELIIDKAERDQAHYFHGVASAQLNRHRNESAYMTKRCPECDEVVKFRAKICKHCGTRFHQSRF
jgi:phage FluMu protein Com